MPIRMFPGFYTFPDFMSFLGVPHKTKNWDFTLFTSGSGFTPLSNIRNDECILTRATYITVHQ